MLNVITLCGRLVKDPELRKSNADVSFATFTLAVDNSYKDADGERGTCFLDCRVFKERAELVTKYCHKGSKVALTGSINQRDFVRNDGSKGKVYEVAVDSIEFLDAKPHPDAQENKEPDDSDLPDDDIPFKEEETKPQEKIKPEPKFDPYTGKPLGQSKPVAKKQGK